jgi:oxygen-independent coproporphyrinogen-3 oxidase
VKIKGAIVCGQDEDQYSAVREVTDIFAIPEVSSIGPAEDVNAALPADFIFIRNSINQHGLLRVKTEVYYRQGPDDIRSMTEERSAAATADGTSARAVKWLVRINLFEILKALSGRTPSPWGILRGVRPSKIVHKLLDAGLAPAEVVATMANDYGITNEKASLVTDVALRQRPFLLTPAQAKRDVSIYIGIPFCPSRCLYCSFPANVLPGKAKIESFLQALFRDMKRAADIITANNLTVSTVYIGGGTPTSLPTDEFSELLARTAELFISGHTKEFTVEAGRPDSLNDGKIAAMFREGVTRISVNPQTMRQKTLKLIGRRHSVQDIIDMFEQIRASGKVIINMDIIAGLPDESEADMVATMEQLAKLSPDNLTVHTLAIKRGSDLKDASEVYNLPSETTTAKMLKVADEYAGKMGLAPYYLYRQKYMTGNLENIGYARPGTEGLYNIQIIEEHQTIIGIGPSAGTKAVNPADWSLKSCYNPKDVDTYINSLDIYLDRREQLLTALFRA